MVRLTAGFYVLAAAVAKTQQLGAGLPLELPAGWPVAAGAILVQLEYVFAAILLSGLWPRLLRWVAPLVFVAFAGFPFSRGLYGAASCGCFGQVSVNPWLSGIFDAIFALGTYAAFFQLCREPPRLADATTPYA